MADSDTHLAAGTMVGGYRVEYKLGAGGVGTVYAGEEPTIKKRVAIKVLKRGFAEDPASAERFEREARAANAIHHPGIVDVFAFGKLDDGRPYLVMSLLDGRSLRDELAARGALPPAEAWAVAREIAEALAAAHAEGIVHRDLKPDNVFLQRYGARPSRPILLDFGIAKVQAFEDGEALQKLTLTGTPIGTPKYMAPEQWWAQEITARTDQYAFGAMLFEMLAGRPPFGAQQFMELAQQHLHDAPPPLASLGVDVGPAVEALVARALAKEPAARFGSITELLEAGDAAFAGSSDRTPAPRGAAAPAAATRASADALAPTTPLASSGLRDAAAAAAASTPQAAAAATPQISLTIAPPSTRRASRRFLAIHVLIMVLGWALIVGVGYAGADQRAPVQWFKMGGFAQFGTLLFALVGIPALPWFARRRARTGVASLAAFWVAIVPSINSTFATYTGWWAIMSKIGRWSPTRFFAVFNEGTLEANTCRFLGFWVATLLCVSLAALPGVSGLDHVSHTLVAGLGLARREAVVAAAALAALAGVSMAIGAPAAVLVALVAAGVLAVGIALPTLHAETAARDEMERGVAGILAVALATAVAFTRVEAREAALWAEQPTRAARVAEIVAAHAERTATTVLALASLVVVIGVEALRMRRLFRRSGRIRPTAGTAALVTAVAVGITGDIVVHGRFIATRDALRAEIASQFVLFARLVPPSGDDLDRERFPPHRAPALQVTRDAIAVNGKGVARLAALDNDEGAARVAEDLARALAQAAVERQEAAGTADDKDDKEREADVDLSVFVDREVPTSAARRLLRIAKDHGARRVDLMLAVGPTPKIPKDAPPETQIVLPHDFVALPIEVVDEAGLPLEDKVAFGDAVRALIATARASEGPVRPIRVEAARR